ncbi:MAG: MoaD/ThiS family protein [Thermoplasmatota archaeon]
MTSKINVKFKFFATTRDIIGKREINKTLDRGTTVEEGVEQLFKDYPDLREYKNQLMIAVNKEIGDKKQRLDEGDEIALLPPVGGG